MKILGLDIAVGEPLRYVLTKIASRVRLDTTIRGYSSPVPDVSTLSDAHWTRQSELPGIDMAEQGQITLLGELIRFKEEYTRFPEEFPGQDGMFYLRNGRFQSVDAEVSYAMVRLYRPARVVEVGSGFSTLVTTLALAQNRAETGAGAEMIAIEPAPRSWLRHIGHPFTLWARRMEEVSLETFTRLGANDILFIDSSHVLRIGNDVAFLFGEVLPRLAPGVLVHIHDIFFPYDYPRNWVVHERLCFTEQYVLQAFLAFNRAFRVLLCNSYMAHRHPALVRSAFPSYDNVRDIKPTSFWMVRQD